MIFDWKRFDKSHINVLNSWHNKYVEKFGENNDLNNFVIPFDKPLGNLIAAIVGQEMDPRVITCGEAYVACLNGTEVGLMVFNTLPDFRVNMIKVSELVVNPDYLKQGVGSAMIFDVSTNKKEFGYKDKELIGAVALTANTNCLNMVKKLGFKKADLPNVNPHISEYIARIKNLNNNLNIKRLVNLKIKKLQSSLNKQLKSK